MPSYMIALVMISTSDLITFGSICSRAVLHICSAKDHYGEIASMYVSVCPHISVFISLLGNLSLIITEAEGLQFVGYNVHLG